MTVGKYNAAGVSLPDGGQTDLQLDASGNLKVASGTGTSSNQVQGNVAHDGVDSGNPVKVGGVARAAGTPPTQVAAGDRVDAWFTRNGAALICLGTSNTITAFEGGNASLSAAGDNGSYYPVNVQLFGLTAGNTSVCLRADTTGLFVVPKPATSGGLSPARVVTGTTGVLKASAGQLYALLSVRNANAAVRYLHIYDKATAPTLSTDTPVLTISLAASSVENAIPLTNLGGAFTNGIAWAYTTDNIAIPTTAGTSTELMFSAVYK